MEELCLFMFGTSGLTIIISASLLFKPFREFFNKKNPVMAFIYKLLSCTMCLGVWIGLTMVFFHDHLPEVFKYASYAGTTSLSAWGFYKALN